jgi:C-terminal processing protease CtpA/Prc
VRWALACALLAFALLAAGCGPDKGTIGAVLAQDARGHLVVHEVPDGLAADKQGLQPGDEILTIDGMDVRMLDTKTVHQVLSGDVGDPVKLTVIRGEEVLRVTVKRTPAKSRKLLKKKPK